MATLTTAEKAPLLLEGSPVTQGQIGSSDPAVASIVMQTVEGGPAECYVVGQSAGACIVTLSLDGQIGSLEVTVTEAPLDITLGTPEPK
jgi:alpha-beta hydrolase superfamily lysophospholipase